MELQELIDTFYQPLVYKIDLTSPLGIKVEPPNFNREIELILEVNEKQYVQCLKEMHLPKPNLLEITLSYKNINDIHCNCFVIEINSEMDRLEGNKFWTTIIIISVPQEIIIQNTTWKVGEVYEEITKMKSGGLIERKRVKIR